MKVHGKRRRRIPKRRCNGVARIFVWGGTRPMSPGTFDVISTSRPHSVGGGGRVAEIISVISITGPRSLGGGVVAEIFTVVPGGEQHDSLNSGPFFYI